MINKYSSQREFRQNICTREPEGIKLSKIAYFKPYKLQCMSLAKVGFGCLFKHHQVKVLNIFESLQVNSLPKILQRKLKFAPLWAPLTAVTKSFIIIISKCLSKRKAALLEYFSYRFIFLLKCRWQLKCRYMYSLFYLNVLLLNSAVSIDN